MDKRIYDGLTLEETKVVISLRPVSISEIIKKSKSTVKSLGLALDLKVTAGVPDLIRLMATVGGPRGGTFFFR